LEFPSRVLKCTLDGEAVTAFSCPLFIGVAQIWNEGFEITALDFDEDLYNRSPSLLGEL